MADLNERLAFVSEWGRSAFGVDMIDLAIDAKNEIARLRTALKEIDSVAIGKQRGAALRMQRVARLALVEQTTAKEK